MSLARYHAKRDFKDTREPRGKRPARRGEEKLQFVVQKHAASRLHYDFRLSIDGVLKSWAVPKGMPLSQGDKKLAMEVEDHPLEYGGFEGIIPAGNYGAGTVMLWDAGICEVEDPNPSQALKRGKIVFKLQGQKLSGEWTLVRMRPRADADERAWLLIKTGGDADPISARSDDRSILSGKTMKQLAATSDNTWRSNRETTSKKQSHQRKRKREPATRSVRRPRRSRAST